MIEYGALKKAESLINGARDAETLPDSNSDDTSQLDSQVKYDLSDRMPIFRLDQAYIYLLQTNSLSLSPFSFFFFFSFIN